MTRTSKRTRPLQVATPEPEAASISHEFMGFHARFRSTDLLGSEVDKWQLERVLGEGGMSVVYEASHLFLQQKAAVKILLPVFYGDDVIMQRFQQEALTLSQLQHPNVIEIKDFGEDPAVGYFMVLALLEGCDLHDVIERSAPLPLSWILALMQQLCMGIEAVHKAGILHRDLKPSNVYLSPGQPFPQVRILDFGVAKVQLSAGKKRITTTGTIVGTPAYLAPEQVLPRNELTPATDIYALGVLLFELLTGRLPFDGDSSIEQVLMVVNETPPLLGEFRPCFAGTPLETLLSRILARSPGERPPSGPALWDDLEQVCLGLSDPRDLPEYMPAIPSTVQQMIDPRPETHDRVRFGVQGTDVFAVDNEELSATDSAEEQGYLSTLDLRPGEQVAASRQALSTEELAKQRLSVETLAHREVSEQTSGLLPVGTDGPVTLSFRRSTFQRGLLLVCAVCLLGGMAGVWMWPHKAAPGVATNALPSGPLRPLVTRRPTAQRDVLAGIVRRGHLAMQRGESKQALALWRRAFFHKDWASHPKLWQHTQGLVRKYEKVGHLASATRLLQRFVGAATAAPGDVAKAQRELAGLRATISARRGRLQQKKRALVQEFKRKHWLLAHLQYTPLRKGWPSSPVLQLWLAQQLVRPFPGLAAQMAGQIVTVLLPTPKVVQQARRLLALCEARLQKAKLRLEKALAQIAATLSTPGKWSDGCAQLRRLLRSGVLLRAYGQVQVSGWLKTQWHAHPTKARSLWSVYRQSQELMLQDERWLWLRVELPQVTTAALLRRQTSAFRLYELIHRRFVAADAAMTRGELDAALRLFRAVGALWPRLQAQESWELAGFHQKRKAQAAHWCEQLASLRLLKRRIYSGLARGEVATTAALEKAFLTLLRGHPARAVFARRFRALRAKHSRRQALFRRANRAYRKKAWRQARRFYQEYRKRYPRTSPTLLRRRLKACRCAMKLFAFEICKPHEFPSHHRPRR